LPDEVISNFRYPVLMTSLLSDRSLDCLLESDPDSKYAAVARLRAEWNSGEISVSQSDTQPLSIEMPGRPARPVLVPPHEIGRRSIHTRAGHAALFHALTHIEFNAINLALDAVYRFRHLPDQYTRDWLLVAAEEAEHFLLLRNHLRTLGYDYGDFEAHDGLWQMCVKTAHDPLGRMALVPRLLEARGLDANPAIVKKLGSIGDSRGVDILEMILRDEIGHVRIGNRWYEYLCRQRGLEPVATFRRLLNVFDAPLPRPPLHTAARKKAGFSIEELNYLESHSMREYSATHG